MCGFHTSRIDWESGRSILFVENFLFQKFDLALAAPVTEKGNENLSLVFQNENCHDLLRTLANYELISEKWKRHLATDSLDAVNSTWKFNENLVGKARKTFSIQNMMQFYGPSLSHYLPKCFIEWRLLTQFMASRFVFAFYCVRRYAKPSKYRTETSSQLLLLFMFH